MSDTALDQARAAYDRARERYNAALEALDQAVEALDQAGEDEGRAWATLVQAEKENGVWVPNHGGTRP